MNMVFKLIGALALLTASIAVQAVAYKVDSSTGKLTGIGNLNVLGSLYDVEFKTGAMDNTSFPPWIFIGHVLDQADQDALDKSEATGTAAALALYSAIRSPSALPLGVQANSTLIQGITNPLPYTILAVPIHEQSGAVISVFPDLASAQPAVRSYFILEVFEDISNSSQTSGNAVYANFSYSKFAFTATPDVLCPHGNKLVPVTVSPNQAGLLNCQITSVSSNELITTEDYQITGDLTVDLRAKRFGKGGRVYTIDISCLLSGSPVTGNVTVTVPRDKRDKHDQCGTNDKEDKYDQGAKRNKLRIAR